MNTNSLSSVPRITRLEHCQDHRRLHTGVRTAGSCRRTRVGGSSRRTRVRGAFTARCNSTRCVYWRSSDQTEGASGSPRMQGASGPAGMQDQGPRCTSRCRSDVVRCTGDIARLGSTTPPFKCYPCAVAVIGSPLVGSPLFPGIGGSAITPRATHAGIGLP